MFFFILQVTDLRRGLNTIHSAANEASRFFVQIVYETHILILVIFHSDFTACYTFQVRGSAKLKRIMQTILSLGNALNHGTARGSAIGFRLDSLLKLTDTRSRNSKMTLMHYLCKVLDFPIVSNSFFVFV
jgi:hypothetical protein